MVDDLLVGSEGFHIAHALITIIRIIGVTKIQKNNNSSNNNQKILVVVIIIRISCRLGTCTWPLPRRGSSGGRGGLALKVLQGLGFRV